MEQEEKRKEKVIIEYQKEKDDYLHKNGMTEIRMILRCLTFNALVPQLLTNKENDSSAFVSRHQNPIKDELIILKDSQYLDEKMKLKPSPSIGLSTI